MILRLKQHSGSECLKWMLIVLLFSPYACADIKTRSISNSKKLFDEGKELFLHEKYTEAETCFKQCVEQEPDNSDYLCWLAQSSARILSERGKKGTPKLSMLGEGRKIYALYTKAIQADPSSERARVGYAVLLRDVPSWLGGDLKKAERMLREVQRDNPQNIFAAHHLGTLYIRKLKKYEEGIDYLKQVLRIADERELTTEEKLHLPNTYHAIGKTYLENLNDAEKAIPYLEKSLESHSNSVVTLLDLVTAYQKVDSINEARLSLRKAAKIVKARKYKYFNDQLTREAKKLKMQKELKI